MGNIGLTGGDGYKLTTGDKRFPGGDWYRLKISVNERPIVLFVVISAASKTKNMPNILRLLFIIMKPPLLNLFEQNIISSLDDLRKYFQGFIRNHP